MESHEKAESGGLDLKDRLTVENAARQTLVQILGGALLIAGLVFTWANLKITQDLRLPKEISKKLRKPQGRI